MAFAWRGLLVHFVPDDMMALFWAYTEPLPKLILGNLAPFTQVYRPAGGALYRGLYAIFGFDPLAFRLTAFSILFLNIGLLIALSYRLSGSRFIAILSGLIGAYHHRALDIYRSTGVIYDVICYTFFLASVLWYIGMRDAPRWWRWPVFYALVVAALNAKEMAVVLPGVLLAYEWFCRGKWISAPLVLASALSGSAVAAKLGSESRFLGNPSYALEFSFARYFENTGRYLADLLYLPPQPIPWYVTSAVYGLVILAAVAMRRADLRILAVWIFITPLAIIFVPLRGLSAVNIQTAGWAMFLAVLLSRMLDWACHVMPEPRTPGRGAQTALACVTAAVLATLHLSDPTGSWTHTDPVAMLSREVKALLPSLPKGARVLFLHDPFGTDNWTPVFILTLMYGDKTLTVDRVKMLASPPTREEVERYDVLFDYDGSRMILVRAEKEK